MYLFNYVYIISPFDRVYITGLFNHIYNNKSL